MLFVKWRGSTLTKIYDYKIFLKQCFWLSIDVDECAVSNDLCVCASQDENPSCKARCINTDGSYECQCSDGYYLFKYGICIGKLEIENSSLN